MREKLSVIVCTYNRSALLFDCLKSLANQTILNNRFEVLIIDNKSTDSTKTVSSEFAYLHPNFRYFFEPHIGLSYARNRGAKEAKGNWLAYIDDDAKAHPNFIERALWVIENYDFDCFGGMYFAWYPYGKPKWLNENFGTKIALREGIGEIEVAELSGGNFLIKKEVLEKAGGFPVNFGMSGEKISYGEEDLLQRKLLTIGYILGFDPELKIDHAVLPHKLKLGWHLRSWYAHGRDGQRVSKEYNMLQLAWLFTRSLTGGIVKTPVCLGKWLMKKDYYWQNGVWDVVSPVLHRFGQIKGALT